MLWVFGLDGVSVALAVALALLALKTCRRQEAVVLRRRRSWKASRGGSRTIC